VGSAVASVVVVVVASIARWDLDGGATSASMTRSGSGVAGAATAIAGSTADAGAALDGAALAGALSNAAASRETAHGYEATHEAAMVAFARSWLGKEQT
jgi:hypothetical protein